MGKGAIPKFSLGPFDSARFAALAEGLEVSVVRLSEVAERNPVLRFDSTYFLRDDLEALDELRARDHAQVGELAYVTDGIHTSIPFEEGSGIKVFSARHPKEGYFDETFFEEIAPEAHAANPRTALREGDVLISTVGTIGNAAVVSASLLPANSDRHVGIIRITAGLERPIRPEFLTAALLSRFGRIQSRRETTGNVQPNLFLDKVRSLAIPRFRDDVERVISEVYIKAESARTTAQNALAQAEADLLDALGLDGWSPPEPLTYTRSAADVFAAGRFDAAYFAPKHDEVLARLKATGQAIKIGDDPDALVARGGQPLYVDDGVPVINSRHVRVNRVMLDHANRRAQPGRLTIRNGDVLINGTGVGTIGRAAPFLSDQPAIPDNHVTVVRVQHVDPLFLSVFLNSPIGQLQVERMISGSSGQIELYPDDIRNLTIWLAPDAVQKRIRADVQGAFDAQAHSTRLLAAARRAVEIAIEESEEAALAFIADVEAAYAATD
ncbi:restriction endonuclease subunit S [Sphingomonas psychrotolerans]|uniref:Restriction endonuclease subunit S n=1 Tax=Sphingomonas psychrotolerans TaxID=1327635 RepID=A0ABU3N4H2_9SPHN|nr:restriction endonuclease subunit S [Sphingomonas psychrotolerans]MDT8758672.1 restriction endonuclease subunit S [Sphingomonas psychrotolerans]